MESPIGFSAQSKSASMLRCKLRATARPVLRSIKCSAGTCSTPAAEITALRGHARSELQKHRHGTPGSLSLANFPEVMMPPLLLISHAPLLWCSAYWLGPRHDLAAEVRIKDIGRCQGRARHRFGLATAWSSGLNGTGDNLRQPTPITERSADQYSRRPSA